MSAVKVKPGGINRTVVTFGNGDIVFFSYQSPVAAIVEGKAYWTSAFHSVTTSRHLREWAKSVAVGYGKPTKQPQEWFDALMEEEPSDAYAEAAL